MIIMKSPIRMHVEQQVEFNCKVNVYKTYKMVAVVEEWLLNQLTSPEKSMNGHMSACTHH